MKADSTKARRNDRAGRLPERRTGVATGRRVLLVNPRATYSGEVAQKCFPPMGLLYLGAALEGAGFEAIVVDANALRLDDTSIVARSRQHRPALVGVALYAETLAAGARTVAALRRALPEAAIVVGGPFVTVCPEGALRLVPDADFALAGEADETIVELARALEAGHDPSERIPGLFTRRGSPLQRVGRFEAHLDELPRPARRLVAEAMDRGLYYALLVGNRRTDCMVTSRGCAHRCHFCSKGGEKPRFRSVDSCLEELSTLRARGVRNVEILDDNFTAVEARALDFFRRVAEERFEMSLRVKARASAISPRLARAAREAGVYQVSVGMESGSPRLLAAMGKGVTVEQLGAAVETVRRHGIKCHTSWIVGYPGETFETLHETERFIRAVKPSTMGVSILRPYPGTVVYERARAEGTLVGEWTTSSESPPWVRLPWTDRYADLVEARRRLMRRIYLRPRYALAYGREIVEGANWRMLRYAAQEARRVLSRRI